MTDTSLFGLTLIAALGSGLIAGAFFAFSSFVMKALGRRPPAQGIAAMQEINVVVINPLFLGVFLGTGAISAVIVVVSAMQWGDVAAAWRLAGGAIYLVVTLFATMAFNVPLNDALAKVAPDSGEGAALWTHYLDRWTMWNHIRTAGALVATAAFILALR